MCRPFLSCLAWCLAGIWILGFHHPQEVDAFLSSHRSLPRDRLLVGTEYKTLCVVKEKKEIEIVNGAARKRSRWSIRNGRINGLRKKHKHQEKLLHANTSVHVNETSETGEMAAMAAEDLTDLMVEINSRLSNGTAVLLKDLTEGVDDKLALLPEKSASELATFLTDLATEIQEAQQHELDRQLAEIEKRFVRPLEELAFSDVPLLEAKKDISDKKVSQLAQEYEEDLAAARSELVLMGENSTLDASRRLRTKEILRNFNVAPVYYSIALLTRWVRKASYPSMYLISLYKTIATVIKSNTKPRRRDRSVGGDNMQAGWKRTGEIASKGPLARKWAVMRRSAEIWAYFSSFYIKDRRISSRYNSGRWSEEKFKAERSKLGKEITQNLLKLGPVSNAPRSGATARLRAPRLFHQC